MRSFIEIVAKYNAIKSEIRQLLIRRQEIVQVAGFPPVARFDAVFSASDYYTSPEQRAVERIMTIDSDIDERQQLLECIRNDIDRKLKSIDCTQAEVIAYRIYTNKSFYEIAKIMNYSHSRIYQFYNLGIAQLGQKHLHV